jgi:two-component system phosphate regulon sensor histidine kinase PhoR
MKRSLVARIDELHSEHALFVSVVSGMKEGLLLVDPSGRVRLANPALRELLEVSFDPTGHRLGEVVRNPTLIQVVERALAERVETRETVVRLPDSGRSFELHATALEDDGGVIVLFFDITRLELLERVRREFVSNVSHELRTPLTAIRAFVETLQAGALEDRANGRRFLEIIAKHSERLQALIDDVTDLSRIETGAVTLELAELDAAQVARDVVEHLRPVIDRYGVQVRIELRSPFLLTADRRRLEQVLTNLIDNAVKFNRPGGTVRLHGSASGGRPVVVVEDDGIGMPADSLDRIFHRFYRVEPARSREAGGTGLGLAIVKHLMRLHGGTVRAESELGRGSRFILEFPERRQGRERSSA